MHHIQVFVYALQEDTSPSNLRMTTYKVDFHRNISVC